MHLRAAAPVLTLLFVGLAGCADSGNHPGPDDHVAANKGAIAGLLVDDRFRPIHLTDSPPTYVYVNSLGFEQGVGFGAGIYYSLQANFVQNVFVGPPEVDVDTFCVIC